MFLPVSDALLDTRYEPDDELRRLEPAVPRPAGVRVGRTCSVGLGGGRRRAAGERGVDDLAADLRDAADHRRGDRTPLLDMTASGGGEPGGAAGRACSRSSTATRPGWTARRQRAEALPEHLRDEGLDAVSEARKVQQQLAEGLEHLLGDAEALRCFRFMNRVMADQRVQSRSPAPGQEPGARASSEAQTAVLAEADRSRIRGVTFQLAFILMQLPLLTRSGGGQAVR